MPPDPAISAPAPSPPGRPVRHAIALVLLCLAVYLPGLFSIPPVNRDESRFAQASRQMLESVALPEPERDPALHDGGLVIPRVAGRDRLKKPPLIYWAQAASAAVFTGLEPARDAIWMYRVPSALAALATALITWRLARRLMSERAAWLAAALLAACPLIVWDAHQARADQLLLATTTLAMAALWSIWSTRSSARKPWLAPLVFWTALAAGVMTKGPITPMVAGLCVVFMSLVAREWRWLARLRPLVGLVIVAFAVAPWVIAVGGRVGWETYIDLVLYETVGRSTTAHEGHWGPPGYHAVLSAALFWPGSLLTLGAVIATWSRALALPAGALTALPARWRQRAPRDDAALFLIAWLAPSWIVFELFSTKLPHYPLPLYPALALMTGLAIDRLVRTPTARVTTIPALTIWTLVGLGLCVGAPLTLVLVFDQSVPAALPIVWIAFALLAIALAAWLTVQRATLRAHLAALGAMTLALALLLGVQLPRTPELWVSPQLADHLAAHAQELTADQSPAHRPVAAVGYHEDSLVFLTRGRLARLAPEGAQAWLDANPAGVLIVPADLAEAIDRAREHGAASGFNYSTGNRVDLRILVRDD